MPRVLCIGRNPGARASEGTGWVKLDISHGTLRPAQRHNVHGHTDCGHAVEGHAAGKAADRPAYPDPAFGEGMNRVSDRIHLSYEDVEKSVVDFIPAPGCAIAYLTMADVVARPAEFDWSAILRSLNTVTSGARAPNNRNRSRGPLC